LQRKGSCPSIPVWNAPCGVRIEQSHLILLGPASRGWGERHGCPNRFGDLLAPPFSGSKTANPGSRCDCLPREVRKARNSGVSRGCRRAMGRYTAEF
jgi:hypothetical protein